MFSSGGGALWLAVASVLATAGVSSVYNPTHSCYSSGLLIKCAQSVTCEGFFTHLQCPANHVIRIHAADYGRHDYITCYTKKSLCQVQNQFCTSPSATFTVAKKCNGRNSCSIRASNFVFGDPCPGTSKYLQVSYFCEPLKVLCEGHTATLHCDAGKVLRIHAADYGRRYSIICSAGRPGYQLGNIRCSSSKATYHVAKACNGKNTCQIAASNSVFGDPCKGTYKYLQLSFFCL